MGVVSDLLSENTAKIIGTAVAVGIPLDQNGGLLLTHREPHAVA